MVSCVTEKKYGKKGPRGLVDRLRGQLAARFRYFGSAHLSLHILLKAQLFSLIPRSKARSRQVCLSEVDGTAPIALLIEVRLAVRPNRIAGDSIATLQPNLLYQGEEKRGRHAKENPAIQGLQCSQELPLMGQLHVHMTI